MACSSASTATTSEEEKREQTLIDAMFLCDEWKSSKGGLSTFNRELAINLAETTTGSLNIHCYVSRSDDQDREDAERHGVNLITAQTVPGSRDALKSYMFIKTFNVFMFGRATFEDLTLKGYDIVANAIGSLGGKFELTFVGSSPSEHRNVERWFLQNTSIKRKQITIRGYCTDQDELKGMFHQSDLVALPSRTEGFGLVGLEAISYGVPILVSGESGVAEALQNVEGGNTVIVGSDEDEWAQRISEVSSQSPEERQANARQLRENYRKVYSWKAECERFNRLIENVVKTANGTSPLTVVPTTSHGKELMEEGQGRKGEQEGMLPLHGSSTSDPEKKLEELHMNLKKQVTCSICLDTYTEPKTISCLHTFCRECLERHARVSQRQGKFRCPECQVEIDLPEGNRFDCLPNSFWHKSLLSVLQEEFRKGTSPSNIPFTAGHQKKWEVRHSTGKFQEKEGGEMKIKVDVDDLKREEQNMQTGMLATESVRCQEVQQPGTSATSAASGSVSYQQKKEEIFLSVIRNYFQTTSPQSIEEFNRFMEYMKQMRLIITGVSEGSVVITVKCESLMILEELWTDYSSGHLGEVVQNCFATEKILKELNLAELRLKTTMDIEEYNACKMFFEKDALRGSFPVVKFSAIDLEEKLAEQSMELKRLRMEGTLPSPGLFHADLEEELKQLRTELFRQRVKGSSPPPIIEMKLKELLQKLQKWRMEGE